MKIENASTKIKHLDIAHGHVNGAAKKIIFFIHGNSGSARTWYKQLDDPGLLEYRMIAIDLPAHGSSTCSPDPDSDYNLPALGKILADVVHHLHDDQPYILVGLSLGTNVIAEALPYLRPSGIAFIGCDVIGGSYTIDQAFKEGLDLSVFFTDEADDAQIWKFVSDTSASESKHDLDGIYEDYKATSTDFRPSIYKTGMAGIVSDEIDALVKTDLPVFVIFGLDERFCNINYLDDKPFKVWRDEIFKLPNARHSVQIDRPEIFNSLLLQYANEMFGE